MKKYLLLIIDSQKGIDESEHWGGNRNNPNAEDNITVLLNEFRRSNFPVIHVQHTSKDPSSPFWPSKKGHQFKSSNEPKTGEAVIQKPEANAFIDTELETHIRKSGAEQVAIVGFVTNNSIEATARMSGNLGFKTLVISDATAAFDKTGLNGEKYSSELVHSLSLANLHSEYAEILNTSDLLKIFNRISKA